MNSREASDSIREWLNSERLDAREVSDNQALLHLHVMYPPTKQGHVFNVVIPKNRNLVLIYTVTRELEANQIRRLNPIGVNTFPPGAYGEANPVSRRVSRPPQLASVDVDQRGIVTVLDDMGGKIGPP